MKILLAFILCLLAPIAFAQSTSRTPINRGYLQTDLDLNGKKLTNGVVIAAGTNVVLTTNAAGQVIVNSTGGGASGSNILAGTGISVTPGGGNATVANTGVTSAVAGTHVTVSGATGAVTIATDAATAATASTVVARDSATNINALTFTGKFIGNGAGITNVLSTISTNGLFLQPDTNQIVTYSMAPTAANATYVWATAVSAYTNTTTHYSIKYVTGDTLWELFDNLAALQYYCNSSTGPGDFGDFPIAWTPINVATNGYGDFGMTNIAYTFYDQTNTTNWLSVFQAGVSAKYLLTGNSNLVRLDQPLYPSAVVSGFFNTNFGLDSVIAGGNGNYIGGYGSGVSIFGSSSCRIFWSGGDEVIAGGELVDSYSDAGVNLMGGVYGFTNWSHTANIFGGIFNGYAAAGMTGTAMLGGTQVYGAANYSLLSGSSTNSGTDMTSLGYHNSISNATRGFFLGEILASTNATDVGAIGLGLTNNNSGTFVMGTTNANITTSNATVSIKGTAYVSTLTASRAVVTDANKALASSATTAAEVALLSGGYPFGSLTGTANVNTNNATQLTSGTVADARLSANVPLLNAANAFTGTNTITSATTNSQPLTLSLANGMATGTAALNINMGSQTTNVYGVHVEETWNNANEAFLPLFYGNITATGFKTGTLLFQLAISGGNRLSVGSQGDLTSAGFLSGTYISDAGWNCFGTGSGPGGLYLGSGSAINFASTSTKGTGTTNNVDAILSRQSAGVLQIGNLQVAGSGGTLSLSNVMTQTITITNAPTLQATNAAPANVTIGVTAPDRWLTITNNGTTFFVPAWIAH